MGERGLTCHRDGRQEGQPIRSLPACSYRDPGVAGSDGMPDETIMMPADAAHTGYPSAQALYYDRFCIDPATQSLTAGARTFVLGTTPFQLLYELARLSGQVVGVRRLLQTVWQGRDVGDGAVRVQIALLRKLFDDCAPGEEYIVNVPLRGYCLTRPFRPFCAFAAPDDTPRVPALRLDAPVCPDHALFGRETTLAQLRAALPRQRFATVTGAGGVGKSAVARDVACAPGQHYGSVAWLDCSAIDGAHAPQQLAALDLARLRGPGRRLLVLDGCDGAMLAVARFAERLLVTDPDVDILATCREPLRAGGEWLMRLRPLALPAHDGADGDDGAAAFDHAGVAMFVAQAGLTPQALLADRPRLQRVLALCRRMDGLPFALALAAQQWRRAGLRCDGVSHTLSHTGAADVPDSPRRAARLRASVAASWQALAPAQRCMLARLAAAPDQLELAVLARHCGLALAAAEQMLEELAEKSLIEASVEWGAADGGTRELRYAMLHTVRRALRTLDGGCAPAPAALAAVSITVTEPA